MSLINTNIQPFKSTAYHDGKFVPVSDANLKGQWSVVFFYPADFTFSDEIRVPLERHSINPY